MKLDTSAPGTPSAGGSSSSGAANTSGTSGDGLQKTGTAAPNCNSIPLSQVSVCVCVHVRVSVCVEGWVNVCVCTELVLADF